MTETTPTRWVSARIGTDLYKTELTTDTHKLTADEPVGAGGADLGPSPGDFIRMSLASCTAITLRMYATRKGFDVREIEVKVNTQGLPDRTIFSCIVNIIGNLDDVQRQRMLQIAKLCPVHKLLTRPIEVSTILTS